ncbi:MAG: hydroxyacylglutathione hydrolase [Gammaproteobacteria bacterium]
MPITDINMAAIAALTDNYIWAINNPKHQCALMVDPGDAKPVIAYLEQHQLKLKGILITHHHWDHVNGVADLIQYCPVPVYGPKQSQFSELTQRLDEGEHGFIHDYFPNFQVLSIPGHTLDHIAYYADNSLFCGDTLFAGGCGRLFEGTPEQLYTSLQKIAALPDTTKLYCAHEYTLNNLRFAQRVEPSNQNILNRIHQVQILREQGLPSVPSLLIEEKQTNPFLRCALPEIAQQAEHYMNQPLLNPVEVFTALRTWKNNFL